MCHSSHPAFLPPCLPAALSPCLTPTGTYTVTAEDVGSRLRAEFTPVRTDGAVGKVAAATTNTVTPGAAILPFLPAAWKLLQAHHTCTSGHPRLPPASHMLFFVLEGGVLQAGGEMPNPPPFAPHSPTSPLPFLPCFTNRRVSISVLEGGVLQAAGEMPHPLPFTPSSPIPHTPQCPPDLFPPDRRVCISVLEGGVLQAGGEMLERAAEGERAGGEGGLGEGRSGEGGRGEGGAGEGDVWVVWYRQGRDGRMERIEGAEGRTYVPQEADYGCCVVAGCHPWLSDGTWGDEVLSAPGPIVLPELSDEEAVSLEVEGRAEVGAVLHALHAVSPALEPFVTAVHMQWWQASSGSDSHRPIDGATSARLPVTARHVGAYLLCSATVLDSFGRSFNSVATTATPIAPATSTPIAAPANLALSASSEAATATPAAETAAGPHGASPGDADRPPASETLLAAPAATSAATAGAAGEAAGTEEARGMQGAQQQGEGEGAVLLEGSMGGAQGRHERVHEQGGRERGQEGQGGRMGEGHEQGHGGIGGGYEGEGEGRRESRASAEAASAGSRRAATPPPSESTTALRISGGPYHTSLFHLHLPPSPPAPAWLRPSSCRIQWYRVPPGGFHALDPQPIPGATGMSYQADVADAHQCLMVELRPLPAQDVHSQQQEGEGEGDGEEVVLRVLSPQVLVVTAGSTKVEVSAEWRWQVLLGRGNWGLGGGMMHCCGTMCSHGTMHAKVEVSDAEGCCAVLCGAGVVLGCCQGWCWGWDGCLMPPCAAACAVLPCPAAVLLSYGCHAMCPLHAPSHQTPCLIVHLLFLLFFPPFPLPPPFALSTSPLSDSSSPPAFVSQSSPLTLRPSPSPPPCIPPRQTHDVGRSGRREHRVVDASRKRFKVVKLTALAAINRVEVRATYDPPFRVETEPGEQERMRVVVSAEKEVELTLPSQRARDVMVLCLRAFMQQHRTAKHH
ncbi:unnamed protein product [Closterium sp. NIES-54]